MPQTPILQFGTSRFLQAHADLFLSEALAGGKAMGPVTVVQSSGDPTRRARLLALAAPEGFAVQIRGLAGGKAVERDVRVTSIKRALDTAVDWPEICRIASEEAEVILSNTSEVGWVEQPADRAPQFEQGMSYPAKLTHLLQARFQATGRAVQVMPTELVPRNGDTLRAKVTDLAQGLSPEFADWVAARVVFVNSLVDRIVSTPLEPAGAVAEPYALWAMETCPGFTPVCQHPDVQVVQDLGPIERRKLFILNLGHTWLVSRWQVEGGPGLVRELLAIPSWRQRLEALYAAEVLPVFAAAGDTTAPAYVQATLDRFANPFLDHRLSDIQSGHKEKLGRRLGGFLAWAQSLGMEGRQPLLQAALSGG